MSMKQGRGGHLALRWRKVSFFVGAMLLTAGVAGCGGGGSTVGVASVESPHPAPNSASSGATSASGDSVLQTYVGQMQKYASCLRSHGVPKIPDPDQYGQILVSGAMVPDQEAFHNAQVACQHLSVPMPAEVGALVNKANAASITPAQKKMYKAYATCMQTHGAPDFPDPAPDGDAGDANWDQSSAGAQRATTACAPIIGDPTTTGPGLG